MKVSKKILLIALWLLTFANYIYSQNIYTIAGTGNPNFSGDGGFAINADMYNITGIARDKTGNIFICDNANHRIRKIDVNGIITTIAGGGTSSADSIPAMSALVGKPWGICSDNFGNVYFTDGYLNQVRKINPAGMIITVAGQASTSGGFSGDGGPAKSALFKYICNLTIDKTGNIYISDFGNGRIRKVDTSGMISTIAGTTTASLGNGGPATAAKVSGPAGVAFDKYGNLYIGELYSYLIRKVDTLGIITTIAGNGTQGYSGDGGSAINASLGAIQGISCDTLDNLYLADKDYSIIRKIDKLGIITTVAGTTYGYSGDGGPAISAKVQPWDVELDSIGNIYIADGSNNVVRKIVANPVGLSENEKKQNMFLFPNPATNILQISNDNNEFKNSIIEVINYLSQTVLKQVYSNSIDVSKLPSGIYTLKINASGKESLYSKFIKE